MSTQEEAKASAIGAIIERELLAGRSNVDVLRAVIAAHPDAKTSVATVNWYRGQMRKQKKEVPTAREIRRGVRERKAADKVAAKKAATERTKEAAKAL